MRMKLLAAAAAGALALSMAGAASATITYTLGTGNTGGLDAYPSPYGSVDVTWVDATHASIVFTAANTAGNQYYFADGGSAAVNVNAGSWSFGNLTSNGPPGTIVGGAAGNEDGFGSFNQTFDQGAAFPNRSTLISFTLTNLSGTWTGDSNVLIGNNLGNTVAAHMGVCTTSPCTAFAATGFASNGGGGPIPEPATWAMMILGFGGIGAMLRRRRVPQLATV